MSTSSSAILAPSAIFSENFVKPLVGQKFTDRQLLMVTRISVLAISLIATVMACMRSNIYELVGESSVLSLVSLFAPLAFGLYWKRSSSTGALISMVSGIITWIIFEFYKISWPSLVPALLVSLTGMIAGSLIWPSEDTLKLSNNV
jgi:Na+/proline symporter